MPPFNNETGGKRTVIVMVRSNSHCTDELRHHDVTIFVNHTSCDTKLLVGTGGLCDEVLVYTRLRTCKLGLNLLARGVLVMSGDGSLSSAGWAR